MKQINDPERENEFEAEISDPLFLIFRILETFHLFFNLTLALAMITGNMIASALSVASIWIFLNLKQKDPPEEQKSPDSY